MRKKLIVVSVIVFAFISVGFVSFAMLGKAKNAGSGLRPLEEMALMDLTHENFDRKEVNAQGESLVSAPIVQPAEVGDNYTFSVSDDFLGIDYLEEFVVVCEGDHILLLITKDAYDSWDGNYYHFDNPIGDDSEPWLRSEDLISYEMLDYLKNEFDDNIYDTMAGVYGIPNSRPSDSSYPDYEEKDKIWTLIWNIRDDAYYDPDATSYIAGYFSLADSNTRQKNTMHIDTFEWEHRCGDGDNPWFDETHPRARPNLYEGTFAHEYQHMIHADTDPDEPSWVDEACADFAMYLCGYGHPQGHIAYYMVYHPMVSLTFWGGGLEDYGASYLWALYMYEHYGGEEFISTLVREQANGIQGVENTLKTLGYRKSFKSIFDDWTIANYLDQEKGYRGKYGYELLEVGTIDTWGYSIEQVLTDIWWGPPDHVSEDMPFSISSDWFYGIEPQPYTAHYYRFTNDKLSMIQMDGGDFSGTLPYSGSYEWYSDADAWAWRSFYQSFDIPVGGATLEFYTYFEIEDDWDYGYVEVHDQDTGEWYTLSAAGTVDYVAHDQDNPNCPPGREPTDYVDAGRWHAFTGYSGGWLPVMMDLTPFAGHTIDLYFTTWQDGAFTLQMMWVDDISITEIGFFDDVEAGEDGWASTGWIVSDGMFDNGWDVTAITVKNVPNVRYPEEPSTGKLLWRQDMWVWRYTQSGTMFIGATTPESEHVRVAIVSNHANHILTSHYDLTIEQIKWRHHWYHHCFWE